MTNNEILHNLMTILDYDYDQMIQVFTAAEFEADINDVIGWSKSHGDASHIKVEDKTLAIFLNGLINTLRGKKDGPQAVAEESLNNNAICQKIKIAFNLQAEEMIELFALGECPLSKHEISAFFRKPASKHFRPCKDDTLRAFIKGLALSKQSI